MNKDTYQIVDETAETTETEYERRLNRLRCCRCKGPARPPKPYPLLTESGPGLGQCCAACFDWAAAHLAGECDEEDEKWIAEEGEISYLVELERRNTQLELKIFRLAKAVRTALQLSDAFDVHQWLDARKVLREAFDHSMSVNKGRG